jgi:hypothetical protein
MSDSSPKDGMFDSLIVNSGKESEPEAETASESFNILWWVLIIVIVLLFIWVIVSAMSGGDTVKILESMRDIASQIPTNVAR